MGSRRMFKWCKRNPDCINVQRVCQNVENDLELFERLKEERPDRYYLLKFEDLFVQLEKETRKLFEFIGLPFTSSSRLFLESHTRETEKKAYSTYRNSNFSLTAWRGRMSPIAIGFISKICSNVLNALNYSLEIDLYNK